MAGWIVALVLATAVLHAGWNAVLRHGGDPLWSMIVMATAEGLVALCCLPLLPIPATASWPYVAASWVLHTGYRLLLAQAYRWGELGVVYPIARGSAPLLVTAAAAVVASERLPAPALAGVALISLGILALSRRDPANTTAKRALLLAFATGLTIAAYTVSDGLGARRSGNAFAYVLWLEMLGGLTMPLVLWAYRGTLRSQQAAPGDGWHAVLGGIASLVAYALVVWALTLGALGIVSALRETSVVFAALIGRLFLGEALRWHRLAAAGVIAAGIVCLALTR
jgi:uncharacterized membrane protein